MRLKKLLKRKALLEDFIRFCESTRQQLHVGQLESKKRELIKVNQQIEVYDAEDN